MAWMNLHEWLCAHFWLISKSHLESESLQEWGVGREQWGLMCGFSHTKTHHSRKLNHSSQSSKTPRHQVQPSYRDKETEVQRGRTGPQNRLASARPRSLPACLMALLIDYNNVLCSCMKSDLDKGLRSTPGLDQQQQGLAMSAWLHVW